MKGGIEELKNELSSKANTNNKNQGVQDINVTIGLENGILSLESIKNALKFAQAAMEGVDDPDVAESIEQINVKFNANGKSFEAKIGKGNNGEGINTSFMSYQPGDIDKMSLKDIQQLFSFTTNQPIKDIKGIKFENDIAEYFKYTPIQDEFINAGQEGIASSREATNTEKVNQRIDNTNNVIFAPITGSIQMSNIRAALKVASIDVGDNEANNKVNINFYDPVQKKGFLVELESINDKSISEMLKEIKSSLGQLNNISFLENIKFKPLEKLPEGIQIEQDILRIFSEVKQQQAEEADVKISDNVPINAGINKVDVSGAEAVAMGVESGEINREGVKLNGINAEKINVNESANLTNKSTQQQDLNQIEILLPENLIQSENIESAVLEALRLIKNNKNMKSDKFKVKFYTFDEKQSFNVEFQFNNLKEIEDLLGTSNADAGITGEELSRLIQNTSFKALESQPEGLKISKKVIIEQEGEVLSHSVKQQGNADSSKDSAVIAKFTPSKEDVEKFFEPPQTNPALFSRIKSYISENPIKAAAIGAAATVVGVGALAVTVATGGLFAVGAGLAGAAIGAGAYGIVKYNQYKDNENIIIGKPENFNHNNDPFKVKDAKIPEQSQATGIKANIEPSKNAEHNNNVQTLKEKYKEEKGWIHDDTILSETSKGGLETTHSTSIVEKLHLAPKTRPELKEPGTHVDQVKEGNQTSGHSI